MLLAVIAGAVLAWLGYYGRLAKPLARWAAFARLIGCAALILLVVDPGFVGRVAQRRPAVLLDRSLSMVSQGGRATEAATLAASLGDTIPFGELAPGLPGGNSRLADLLTRTAAGGRAVVVVTDGEISDSALIPAELRQSFTVRTLARLTSPDIAIVSARAPERLAAGDTLTVDLELWRSPGAADSISVEIRDSTTLLGGTVARFKGTDHSRAQVKLRLPSAMTGEHRLVVGIAGPADGEPGDDLRWLRLVVTPTPGIVVLSSPPDWEGRTLYRTIKDVADAPVIGYAMLQSGRWFRMSDLQPVTSAAVSRAARAATFLAVRGDIAPWKSTGQARLLWSSESDPGDWFLSPNLTTPVGGAFAGVVPDSLPVLTGAHAIPVDQKTGWIAAVARRSRRGAEVPVIGGSEGPNGRTVYIGADGFFGWANRGGISEQTWRALVASATSWALASSESDSARARPLVSVTQRGRPVRFRWIGSGAPTSEEIEITSGSGIRVQDSLRFDSSAEAIIALETGWYRYRLSHGGAGTFAVEPYADEFLPHPVTLASSSAVTDSGGLRQSWRSVWWLFALAVAAFGVEWLLRRRIGAA